MQVGGDLAVSSMAGPVILGAPAFTWCFCLLIVLSRIGIWTFDMVNCQVFQMVGSPSLQLISCQNACLIEAFPVWQGQYARLSSLLVPHMAKLLLKFNYQELTLRCLENQHHCFYTEEVMLLSWPAASQ